MELMHNIMLWSHVLDVAGDAWHFSSLSVVHKLSALSIDLLFFLYFHSLHPIPSRLYIDSYTIWLSDPSPTVRGMPRNWAKWETTIGACRRVPMRRKWCHWNRRVSPEYIWILIFEMLRACMTKWIWTNGDFRREGSSRSRRVPTRRKWCHWNRRTSSGHIWILIFENVACTYDKINLDKWWFSLGGVFSEQASAHDAKMVSMEPQNIPGVHLDINIWKCCVYVW